MTLFLTATFPPGSDEDRPTQGRIMPLRVPRRREGGRRRPREGWRLATRRFIDIREDWHPTILALFVRPIRLGGLQRAWPRRMARRRRRHSPGPLHHQSVPRACLVGCTGPGPEREDTHAGHPSTTCDTVTAARCTPHGDL